MEIGRVVSEVAMDTGAVEGSVSEEEESEK